MQENSNPSALPATCVSSNIALNAGSGGSTITSRSSWQLDSNTSTTTASQFRILQILPETDNAVGNYARWLGFILQHSFANLTGV
jgi:hypothetical protein